MLTEDEITALAERARHELAEAAQTPASQPAIPWQRKLHLEGVLIGLEAALGVESESVASQS